MLERLVVVLSLVILVIVAGLVMQSRARRRVAAARGQVLPGELRARFPSRASGILYFFGPHCPNCRQQVQILDQLAHNDGVPIVRVDAVREPHLADALAVTTIPATVIVDTSGTVRTINLGFRSRDELAAQLGRLGNLAARSALT